MSAKLLLLVPPARDLIIRDYYCSKRSQARYLHPPLDLAVQGGWARARGLSVELLDATVDRLSPEVALARAVQARPDAVFALAGAVSWDADRSFLSALAQATDAPVYASGDVFMEDPAAMLERCPFLAGVLTDFSSDELACRLAGERPLGGALFLRGEPGRSRPRQRLGHAIPVPAHDLFLGHDYRYPFARAYPMAGIYTQYGCPYRCSFCITGELGSAVRPTDNVMQELLELKRLGVRELFVQDQCFGCAPREPFERLLDAMIREELGFGWWTFTRVDVLDRDLIRQMKAAGCHTLILGVESASEEILARHRKGYGPDRVRAAFELCRQEGMASAATFILGLPEETPATLRATIDLACSLPADYASFNVAVPRAGTRLRARALSEGLMDAGSEVMDQSGFGPTLRTPALSPSELSAWRRRAVASFYLRPAYLARRMRHLRTLSELRHQAAEAWMLVRNLAAR